MTVEDMIRPLLNNGEQIMWAGMPVHTPVLDRENRITTIIRWTAWPLLSTVMFFLSISHQLRTGEQNSPILYICFIVIPLLFMAVPIADHRRLTQKTSYAITNQRVIINNGKKDYPSRPITTLDGFRRIKNDDGTTTLCFGKAACETESFSLRVAGIYGVSDGVTGNERGIVFYHINDCEQAVKHIPALITE